MKNSFAPSCISIVIFIAVIVACIPARAQVSVLCYHQIRDYKITDSKSARTYIVPTSIFRKQMKALYEAGYQAVLPDQLLIAQSNKKILPAKAVVITFDDGSLSQYINALPVLNEYSYKAVFFIMTVSIGRTGFMNKDQIKSLSTAGHIIGCHTWDHQMVTRYLPVDWEKQLAKPTRLLEQITGKRVKYFAYPNGIWDNNAIIRLKAYGYEAAFQLMGKIDKNEPAYTFKRMIVDGNWNAARLIAEVEKTSLNK